MSVAPPRCFQGQFLLSISPADIDNRAVRGASITRLGSVSIARLPRLRQHDVLDADHRRIGVLLGDPVDLDRGVVVDGALVLPAPLSGDIDTFVERHIYPLGGRFLFVLDHGNVQRLYLDACGSHPAVFDPQTGCVASSAGLLLDVAAYEERFRVHLYEHLKIRRDGWFPAGLTAHEGVQRLLVNHYLDLRTSVPTRHWPIRAIETTPDPDVACRRIIAMTRCAIDAFLRTGPLAMSLTAGNETRLLLAAVRDISRKIDLVTVDHWEGRLDRVRAQELAERFGLRHRCLPAVTATPEQAEDWHARSGHCIGGPNMVSHPTVEQLSSASFFVGGMGGEIGRGFFWRPTDKVTTLVSATNLVSRFGMPPHDEVIDAVESWLTHLPEGIDTFLLLDLAYLELRMGPWAFAQTPGTLPVREAHPLISRRSFEDMLSLPPEWRASNRMILRSIELHWPELLELPINRFGDWRDPARQIERAVRRPHLVVKRLRKRFG